MFCKKLDILPLLLLFLPTSPAIKLNHLETWALTCVGVYTKRSLHVYRSLHYYYYYYYYYYCDYYFYYYYYFYYVHSY